MNIENKSLAGIDDIKKYLYEKIYFLNSFLSLSLSVPFEEIKISFPSLSNFYSVNNILKSSWAIYQTQDEIPHLFYTGNYLIQGGNYSKRSKKSPFGVHKLEYLTSIASTISLQASEYKQNWTSDIAIESDSSNKLLCNISEYKEFLRVLNQVRAYWLLHLCEEANLDFVICEFSEPSNSPMFIELSEMDSQASSTKSYFKLISNRSIELFQTLALKTEFEGRFLNLQPGIWISDDVLITLEKLLPDQFFNDSAQASSFMANIPTKSDLPFKQAVN